MQNQNINRELQVIRSLITKVDRSCSDDIELRSHWAKYICVLASGFLENSIYEVFSVFVDRAASQPVADYAKKKLSRIQNPKAQKIVEVLGEFKADWRNELKKFLDEKGRGSAIDSIMSNRHQIAHGKNSDITLIKVKDYLEKSVQVIEFIERQVDR